MLRHLQLTLKFKAYYFERKKRKENNYTYHADFLHRLQTQLPSLLHTPMRPVRDRWEIQGRVFHRRWGVFHQPIQTFNEAHRHQCLLQIVVRLSKKRDSTLLLVNALSVHDLLFARSSSIVLLVVFMLRHLQLTLKFIAYYFEKDKKKDVVFHKRPQFSLRRADLSSQVPSWV
jgi:hypothetical protein